MEEIADGVFIETMYEGVNVGAILTSAGVVCIDVPSYPRDARDWANRVERLHGRGVKYLLLTDYNGDRILNSRWLNAPIITHQVVGDRLGSYDKRYPQSLLDSLMRRNPVLGRELTNNPVVHAAVTFSDLMTLHAGAHALTLLSVPGPTPGNIWVSWPEAGILFTGDSVVSGFHPPLSEMCLQDWLASIERLIAEYLDAALIVPGRGEPGSSRIVAPLQAYLQRLASLAQDTIAAGGSRQELIDHLPEIAAYSPFNAPAREWVDREVSLGLQRVYDEFLFDSKTSIV